jgi:hypothetical protein
MKPDYMTLSDGRKVRVELDLNSMTAWSQITGSDLKDVDLVRSKPVLLRALAYCCIIEGEAIDGKEFELSEEQFGRLMRMNEIAQFGSILNSQCQLLGQKKKSPGE